MLYVWWLVSFSPFCPQVNEIVVKLKVMFSSATHKNCPILLHYNERLISPKQCQILDKLLAEQTDKNRRRVRVGQG